MILLTLVLLCLAVPVLFLLAKLIGAILYWPLRILGGLVCLGLFFMLVLSII